jgi:hypothetical protein
VTSHIGKRERRCERVKVRDGAGVGLRYEIKRTRIKSENQTVENIFDPSLHFYICRGGSG